MAMKKQAQKAATQKAAPQEATKKAAAKKSAGKKRAGKKAAESVRTKVARKVRKVARAIRGIFKPSGDGGSQA